MTSLARSVLELWVGTTAASAGGLAVVVTVQSGLARVRRTASGTRARRGTSTGGTT